MTHAAPLSKQHAHRTRRADAFGDVGVGDGGAHRDLAQRLPDAALEGGAAHVQRQVQAHRGVLDETDHRRHPLLEFLVGADQPGRLEAVLQVAHQLFGILVQRDFADAGVAGRHQQRAERALAHGSLAGYRWGIERKRELIEREAKAA